MAEKTNKPQMTVQAGRPIKLLNTPDPDVLVSCRTASGEDCYVPLSALAGLLERSIVAKIQAQGPTTNL